MYNLEEVKQVNRIQTLLISVEKLEEFSLNKAKLSKSQLHSIRASKRK